MPRVNARKFFLLKAPVLKWKGFLKEEDQKNDRAGGNENSRETPFLQKKGGDCLRGVRKKYQDDIFSPPQRSGGGPKGDGQEPIMNPALGNL
jgi:hypothetical protein